MSKPPLALEDGDESKIISSPQWYPGISKGSGFGAWIVRIVVSARFRARAKFVNDVIVSPRPWRRRRIFGDGCCDA